MRNGQGWHNQCAWIIFLDKTTGGGGCFINLNIKAKVRMKGERFFLILRIYIAAVAGNRFQPMICSTKLCRTVPGIEAKLVKSHVNYQAGSKMLRFWSGDWNPWGCSRVTIRFKIFNQIWSPFRLFHCGMWLGGFVVLFLVGWYLLVWFGVF